MSNKVVLTTKAIEFFQRWMEKMSKMMKRVSLLTFLLFFIVSGVVIANNKYKGFNIVNVIVNGVTIKSDVPGINLDGRTLVPLRVISESLGAEVNWDDKSSTAKVVLSDQDGVRKKLTEANAKVHELNEKLSNSEKKFTELMADFAKNDLGKIEQEGNERSQPGPTWGSIKRDYYIIHYPQGYEKDAQKMRTNLDTAIAATLKEYQGFNLDNFFKNIADINVFISQTANRWASTGTWTILVWGNYHTDLHLLAQSAHAFPCCTNTGEEFNDSYFLKTTIHETFTLPHMYIVGSKKEGWNNVHSVPGWWGQGADDYFGHKYTPNSKALSFHKNRVIKDNLKTIHFSTTGITVANDYEDGIVLIGFLYETYGKEKFQKVLTSKEKTFEAAFLKEYGSYENLQKPFEAWLNKK
nr:copper amine oxidase N-terminal domain-containing protein [Anaerobacillus isosaccharinicus]QOY37152.1 copper amine oxidase N-terminal domain-containing protein [Anaerobacillus isosaccharinicus]